MEKSFDVFISHNSKDKPTVRQLAEALQRRGLRVWLDEWELVPGHPWQEALEEIIRTTRSAAVLVGKDGIGPWEVPEMRGCLSQFIKRRLPVIPVLLPDALGQPDLPLFLEGFTWVDLRTGGLNEANLDRLEWGITGRKPVPRLVSEPPPEPPPGSIEKPEITAVPPKEGRTQHNWLIGVVVVAVIGLLLEAIIRMQPAPLPPSPVAITSSSTSPTKEATPAPVQEFSDKLQDGTPGPEMVKIRGGRFLMGSPADEKGRGENNERRHEVQVADFAIGKYEVTVGQFKSFVAAAQYKTEAEESGGCYSWTGSEWKQDAGKNWRNPGFSQTDDHPVVCVSWNDAMAYVEWLSKQTGQKYRLPTEAEWEYAARAGTATARYWGDDPDEGCTFANGADQSAKAQFKWTYIMECQDGYAYTAPVGHFRPNAWGLYDMLGNVWEWTCSEYDKDYGGAEQRCVSDRKSSDFRVLRGGSWYGVPSRLRGAARHWDAPHDRHGDGGIRLART
ncbi:MAG: SUMF1/EgtB/PvdO family nonheme iron enzyme [Candidatus Competibacteraceae bacterium]